MAEREALKREIEELQSKCDILFIVVSAFPQTLRSLLAAFKRGSRNSVADLAANGFSLKLRQYCVLCLD